MIVDLIILALVVAAGVVGHRAGLSRGALTLLGVVGGVVLGSRLAPLVPGVDARSSSAVVAALPAAAVIGVLLATCASSVSAGARRRRRRRDLRRLKSTRTRRPPPALERFGPPLFGVCVALAAVWLVGAALAQVDALREPLRESEIVRRLNAVLLPPGPLLRAETPVAARYAPVTATPRSGVAFKADPQVRGAARSVVKLVGIGCGGGVSGSGWLVRPGIVITNAHVVAGSRGTLAQAPGRKQFVRATPIWFDQAYDIAILRVRALRRARALELAEHAMPGTAAAILGYPAGGPYDVQFARIGGTASIPEGAELIGRESGERRNIKITQLLGRSRPGNSGGPVVDGDGRVLAMVFGGDSALGTLGVPLEAIRAAMRQSGVTTGDARRVSTGPCRE